VSADGAGGRWKLRRALSRKAGNRVRHGLSPQQLFGWRRDARGDLADGGDDACGLPRPTATPFVPIVVATAADHPDDVAGIAAGGGQIEIAIAGVLIRLRGEFDARMLRVVLQAVRATS